MKEGSQEHDASEREADSFELQLHQKLGSKQAKVGWGFVLVGFIFAMNPFIPLVTAALLRPAALGSVVVNVGVSSFVLPLILSAIGVSFLRKASTHREQAKAIEHRIRKTMGPLVPKGASRPRHTARSLGGRRTRHHPVHGRRLPSSVERRLAPRISTRRRRDAETQKDGD
jgi:hypothetical protein